ncbi:MAG: sugar ABC transporter ATP-binding protein [Alphaproteobacteria bacterium]|nr:sugar ABC transporter ATP-binding protein [Alphaproteobacteria bacterium]
MTTERDGQAAQPANASAEIAVRATGMRKVFDGVEVLHGVDLELRAGEVHALLGENGAGKSTIINLLSGRLRPDGGQVALRGTPVAFRNPLAARRAGISVIAQELEVVPTLTIVENIFLGAEPTRHGLIRWAEARRRVVAVLRELGVDAEPDRIVGSMSVADQQLVEIAKAIVGEFRVLIMDEPTSALNLAETERLFRIVRRLRADGVAILYVSHRLWEVFELADRVTVVRDGDRILTSEIATTDVDAVIHAMLGSRSSLIADTGRPRRAASSIARASKPVLEVEALQSGELLRDISLSVHPGEVIGLAGVLGSGRTELAEAIYGLRGIDAGAVRLDGEPVDLREPKEALRRGVFLLPEDRKSEGIFGHLNVRENVILNYDPATREPQRTAVAASGEGSGLRRRSGLAPIRRQAERRAFDAIRAALSIRCSSPSDRITALSGGNQQKALFARAALAHPRMLFLSEPTRGVDVGAKEEIYAAIDAFAERGIAIVVSSSELGELLRLASRIYVLRTGRIVAQVSAGETGEADILKLMAG